MEIKIKRLIAEGKYFIEGNDVFLGDIDGECKGYLGYIYIYMIL